MGRLQSRYRHAINDWTIHFKSTGLSKRHAKARAKRLFGTYRRWLQGLNNMKDFF